MSVQTMYTFHLHQLVSYDSVASSPDKGAQCHNARNAPLRARATNFNLVIMHNNLVSIHVNMTMNRFKLRHRG